VNHVTWQKVTVHGKEDLIKMSVPKKMCDQAIGHLKIENFPFFLIKAIVNYIYNKVVNLIRNIEIDYFYFILNIEITGQNLANFYNNEKYYFQSQKHPKVVLSNVVGEA
jgi:hypothetical protein